MKMKYVLCSMLIILIIAASYLLFDNVQLFEAGEAGKMSSGTAADITNIPYQKDGIEGSYPAFLSGGSEEELKKWNQIIESDFNKILHIYAFNPIPGPAPEPVTPVPTILKINYELKNNSSGYISIFYQADYNSPYSAHPSELVYTTDIDKEKGNRLKLSDIVKLDKNFVKEFRNWTLVTPLEGGEDVIQAAKDYLANMSDEDLLKGFAAADIIGSGNLRDVNSYLTQDKLGISIGAPPYLGDHLEYERDLNKLKDYLKPDIKLP